MASLIIKPIELSNVSKKPVQGGELFAELYSTIFAIGRKKSGKSNAILHILRNTIGYDINGNKTKIVFFVPTIHRDQTYTHIVDYLRSKKYPVQTHENFIENKVDLIEELLDEYKDEKESKSDSDSDTELSIRGNGRTRPLCREECSILWGGELTRSQMMARAKKKKKIKVHKKTAPSLIIIFDDLSSDLRKPSVAKLIKIHRHLRSKIIFSSQYSKDVSPEILRNMDYVLAYAGITQPNLVNLHSKLGLGIEIDEFLEYYEVATSAKYEFLYIDSVNDLFRISFHTKLN